jgi:hypothetical protein
MKKIMIGALLTLLTIGNTLRAEIEQVEVRWNALKCLDICAPSIERNLKSISSVTSIQINAQSGTAVLGWAPNSPFIFEPFRRAAAAVGIRFNEIRLRIRGTIAHHNNNFYLISNGDNNRYVLVGLPPIQPGRFSPRFNAPIIPLAPEVQKQLLEAERNHYTVLVLGLLSRPDRNSNILMTEKIQMFVK